MRLQRKRLRALAAEIRKSKWYQQDLYVHTCGAPACIAGHAAAMSLKADEEFEIVDHCGSTDWIVTKATRKSRGRANERAAHFLGLLPWQADQLFTGDPGHASCPWPEPWGSHWRRATTKREKANVAADLLEAIADGKVEL